jgi:ABC-type polysaccharide/polyol phosphate export permease
MAIIAEQKVTTIETEVRQTSRGDVGWRPAGGEASPLRVALFDLIEGIRRWYLWTHLGWHDIRQRYRRSIIGPFWVTLSMAFLVLALGFVYSGLFKENISTLLPYIAGGFIFWGFISISINESCVAFTTSENVIRQTPMPLVVHVLRVISRNFVILLHNLAIWVIVAVWFSIPPTFETLLVVPGALLVCANLAWLGLILAIVCARFRDVVQIVSNIVQIAFFITPLMWKANYVEHGRFFLVDANPFHHLLAVSRDPLLGVPPSLESWLFCGVMAVLGWLIAIAVFLRCRRFVPYWL